MKLSFSEYSCSPQAPATDVATSLSEFTTNSSCKILLTSSLSLSLQIAKQNQYTVNQGLISLLNICTQQVKTNTCPIYSNTFIMSSLLY